MWGRIEISFSCSAFSLGNATELAPPLHEPVEPPDVTASPAVDGTHKKTEDAPSAEPTTPTNTTPTAVINNTTRLIDTVPFHGLYEQRTPSIRRCRSCEAPATPGSAVSSVVLIAAPRSPHVIRG